MFQSSNNDNKGDIFKICQMKPAEHFLNTKVNVDSFSQAIGDVGVVGNMKLNDYYMLELQGRSLLNNIFSTNYQIMRMQQPMH